MTIAVALVITVVSACCLNLGYLIEHQVASKLPPLSIRHPIAAVRSLLGSPRWVMGFGIEIVGWILYVVALALAPLSLVQATAAGGIGILALMVARITHVPLARHERIGAAVSVGGLALLGISLVGGHGEGDAGDTFAVALWLGASAVAAVLCMTLLSRVIGGAAWGIAAGILFSAGDVATKVAVEGDSRTAAFVVCLIAGYGAGTAVLQAGFQRTGALVTAGLATLFTNALPIAAGMTVFGEPLPGGWAGVLRVASFAAVVAGAVLLAARTAHGGEALADRDAEERPAAGLTTA